MEAITYRNTARLREKAQIAGLVKYQGKPCHLGHSGIRYSNNGTCVECTAIYKANHVQLKVAAQSRSTLHPSIILSARSDSSA